MIPIYIKKKTIEGITSGRFALKKRGIDREVDDLLMYNMAKINGYIDYEQEKKYGFRKGDKVKMKVSEEKEINYNDILETLSAKEQVFFLLYNSINYVDKDFNLSPYLNVDLSYMLAFIPNEDYPKYGKFITKEERKKFEEDYGYDKTFVKGGTTLGLFEFHDAQTFFKVHRNALSIAKREKIRNANNKLVSYFLGEDEEIRQLILKTMIDTFQNTKNEENRIKTGKVLGEWYGLSERSSDTTVNVILDSIKVADAIHSDEKLEFEE